MYKGLSNFLKGRNDPRKLEKKSNTSNTEKIAGNVRICLRCRQAQLKTDSKNCLKCDQIPKTCVGEFFWGAKKFFIFSTFEEHLLFLKKTTDMPSGLNNLYLEIYLLGLWEVDISQHVYPEKIKFVLSKIQTDIKIKKIITGKKLFEGELDSLATTRNICRRMFTKLCRKINEISDNKIKSDHLLIR